jgi:hypothetical protein
MCMKITCAYLMKKPKTWTLCKRINTLEWYVRDLHADFYRLGRSSWNPLQGIDKLLAELKEKGPLMVGGNLGRSSYAPSVSLCTMTKQISGRDIYYWEKGTEHQKLTTSRTILLVGAKKTQNRAFVYFIDPQDPSDPLDRSKQKIYMISYENLTSIICSVYGECEKSIDTEYAYHGHFKI